MNASTLQILGLGAAGGLLVSSVILCALYVGIRKTKSAAIREFVLRPIFPLLVLGAAFGARFSLPMLGSLDGPELELIRRALVLTLVGATGWALIRLSTAVGSYVEEAFPVSVADNLNARRIHTRFRVLRRVFVVLTVVLCAIAAMMTFPGMRALGAGFLASAGIIGIVVGVAARPTVEALIAGIQLAWTQPIRLDDVVIIEGEWGRIEEIEATYVVVRLWDLRRLVVPISYLLSQPFQNWTRSSSDLLGAVAIEVDYRTPVAEIREKTGQILAESALFGGDFWNLQVVDAGSQTMKIRVLFRVPNADVGWELRCEVREKLLEYLQQNLPDCLPRIRAELGETAAPAP